MSNNRYKNGKIFKLVNTETHETVYIGSTLLSLSRKFSELKFNWKSRKNTQDDKFTLFENDGYKHLRIQLIESYPCNSKDELNARELEIKRMRQLNQLEPRPVSMNDGFLEKLEKIKALLT